MIELAIRSRFQIDHGDFPLNHDCIVKVLYISDTPFRYSYFTCRAQDSGLIDFMFSSLPIVKSVEFSSVDELSDTF